MRETNLDAFGTAPRWIVVCLGAYLAVDVLALFLWRIASQAFSIQGASDSTSALPVIAMAGVSVWLCVQLLRSFPSGAPLRSAWMLIALASAAKAGSGILALLLGSDWVLNPLLWAGHAQPELTRDIRLATLIAGGPVQMVLLAAGLLAGLRILRRFGFEGRPTAAEWAVCGVVGLFTLCRFMEAVLAGAQIGMEEWSKLAGLPLLCVLFLEATVLRQAVARMGNGLISKCWGAFVWGIFVSGLAELALWLIPHYSRVPLANLESLMQLVTAAIFALAPAYQLAAQRRATKKVLCSAGLLPVQRRALLASAN